MPATMTTSLTMKGPDKEEDLACSRLHFDEEAKGTGEEEDVPAVPVSFDDEADEADDHRPIKGGER